MTATDTNANDWAVEQLVAKVKRLVDENRHLRAVNDSLRRQLLDLAVGDDK